MPSFWMIAYGLFGAILGGSISGLLISTTVDSVIVTLLCLIVGVQQGRVKNLRFDNQRLFHEHGALYRYDKVFGLLFTREQELLELLLRRLQEEADKWEEEGQKSNRTRRFEELYSFGLFVGYEEGELGSGKILEHLSGRSRVRVTA